MTDEPRDDDETTGIPLDANGDPVRLGSLMVERQAYERVVDGLRIAAEACMHLARWERTAAGVDNRKLLARNLDSARRTAVRLAGIEDTMKLSPTAEVRGAPLAFKVARNRLIDGLTQAAGGARQLATCFRLDLRWSRTASELEDLIRKSRHPVPARSSPLLLPTGYVRH